MLKRFLTASAVAAAVTIALAAAPAGAQVHVAVAGPLTGEYASFGAQMQSGAEQAVADINARGGVLGEKLVLEVGDDACDAAQAVAVAQKFASDHVTFVAGHYCSSASIPASKVYAKEAILQITPASTNPKFTDEGGWNTFRTCGRDDKQGEVTGRTLATEFKDKKVAILHDNSTYGKGIADETKKNANAQGKQETLYAAYTPGEKDYTPLIDTLKQAGIEVIYIGGYHTEIGLIARQAKDQGLKVQIIAPDTIQTDEFWQIAGDAGEGVIMTFAPDPRKRPAAAVVVKEFRDRGVEPEGYTLYTYAAFQAWAEAAEKAKSTDPKQVADALKTVGPWDTVLGPLAFDAKGDITKAEYVWSIWHNGAYSER